MNGRSLLCLGVAVLCGWAVLSVAGQKATQDAAVYQVTEWPAASDSRPYREFLQEYLNVMASKGWRLDQDLNSATGARMLVFRREG